jgi:RND superfamily putative drug exporter
MSTFLYKVGKSAYEKPWYFTISWIVILGIVLAMLGVNGIHVSSEMKIEGTESQKVLDQLAEELPEASGGQASVVFTAPNGERLDTPERLTSINKAVNEVYSLDYMINPAKLATESSTAPSGNTHGDGTQQATTAEMPPYGPLMVNGVPVPGVMLSSAGGVALFQFQFTVQQMSLPNSITESIIKAVMKLSRMVPALQHYLATRLVPSLQVIRLKLSDLS